MKVRPIYSSDCHIQRRSCYHPLQQERSYHHTCTARHRHCNPRIPHLYWPLALLVTRPISLDQRNISIALFTKDPIMIGITPIMVSRVIILPT